MADDRFEMDEDVLDGRSRLPRWATALIALVLVGVVAVLIVVDRHHNRPVAKPTPAASATSSAPRITQLGANDIAIDRSTLYVLSASSVYRVDVSDPANPAPAGYLTLSDFDYTAIGASYHLVLDQAQQRLWVISYGVDPAAVVELDISRPVLARVRTISVSADVGGAAVLDGHLYLATTQGVFDITGASRQATQLIAPAGRYFSVSADPTRHRLAFFGHNGEAQFVTYDPSTRKLGAFVAGAPFGRGSLVVVDATIWAGGYGPHGAVLDRLDPATLRPVAGGPLAAHLGPGAVLVATGTSDFWVRSGAGGTALWCVDGRTGRALQSWQLSGPITSATGIAFRAQGTQPARLPLGACRG
ncbi:MAG: hypothetical protein ACR2LF_10700 [Jatrophihabitantaceae bacterium]